MSKGIVTLVFVYVLMLIGLNTMAEKTPVEEYGKLSVSGTYVVDSAGNPVQLRGMSLYWSQWQGNYYTYNTVKWLRDDWKCSVIRAAMAVQNGGYITNPETEKQKIKTVIEAAIDLDIYVIIDWHSHTALNAPEKAEAVKFFTEMAKTYGKYPNIIYETFNEPLSVTWTSLKAYHESIIDSIRKYDSTNIVVCGTSNWSQDVDRVINNEIDDENVAYTLHYYAATHKDSYRAKAQKAIDAGLCLFVTEFGTCASNGDVPIDETSTNIWFDFLDDNKISWCNWSVANVVEAASIITPGTSPNGNWTSDQITTSGKIIRGELLTQYMIKNMTSTSKPIVISQLSNAVVGKGMSHKLSINAISPDTLIYQWYQDTVELQNGDGKTYTITSFDSASIGSYFVKISNSNGSVFSDTVDLSMVVRSPYKGVIAIPGVIEAENFDEGTNGYTYFDADAANTGTKYRTTGVDIEASEETDGFQVGWTATGEWLEYTVRVDSAGEYSLRLYAASTTSGGALKVDFGYSGSVTYYVNSTGSWTKRAIFKNKMNLQQGEQIVRLNIANGISFNIDKLEVIPYWQEELLSEKALENSVSVSPNPTNGFVAIHVEGKTTVKVYNSMMLLDEMTIDGDIDYSLVNYDPGVYFFQFISDKGSFIKQIVKQ